MSIIELGGYPNFSSLYQQAGFQPQMVQTMRKALRQLKSSQPDVIVAEFNFQSDFRDRTSSLESLLAMVQRMPDTQVIIFYEQEFRSQLQKVLDRFAVAAIFAFPIDEQALQNTLQGLNS